MRRAKLLSAYAAIMPALGALRKDRVTAIPWSAHHEPYSILAWSHRGILAVSGKAAIIAAILARLCCRHHGAHTMTDQEELTKTKF
jgi:hypothetical protein